MKYNHERAMSQMAKELGCKTCEYFQPDKAIVCNRPHRKVGITTDERGKCLAYNESNKEG